MDVDLPATLQVNAWAGGAAASPLAKLWTKWAGQQHMADAHRKMAAGEPADERDWRDPRVGWGLVVADNDAVPIADRAAGNDLPQPLQELVKVRKGPILRYREGQDFEFLYRYYPDGTSQPLSFSQSKPGVERSRLPMYLLIWGSPAKNGPVPYIPWRFQYVLNASRYVGRIHLDGEPLENYVSALLGGWNGSPVRADRPLVWSVDHAPNDITHLMRRVVAEPVYERLKGDPQIGAPRIRFFKNADATAANLVNALGDSAAAPAFILTTSHGMTGPQNDAAAMRATLGFPVDQQLATVAPGALLNAWNPNGAIWYAHACCSAGSDDTTQYDELIAEGSVKDILKGVAGLGAAVAPLPTALLGAKQPLRAFIGHVEPTFDWTLRHPENQQPLTHTLWEALYDKMYRATPEPVGMAFKGFFAHVGQLFSQFHQAKARTMAIDPEERLRARAAALRTQLGGLDRQACVILGDPTVALPPLG